MPWHELISRLARLGTRRRREHEIDEELRFHIEMLTSEHVRRGMSPQRARTEALRSFGGLAQVQEKCREVRSVIWITSAWRDLVYGVRTLIHSRLFSLASIITLALGIGAAASIFSILSGLLLTELPYTEADRLMLLRSVNVDRGDAQDYVSVADFEDWQQHAECLESAALYQWSCIDLRGDAGSERIEGLSVTPGYFETLLVEPVLGRPFSVEEYESKENAIVISGRLWRRRFAADPDLIGRSIDIHSWRHYPDVGAVPYRVVGIVDGDVRYPPVEAGLDGRLFGVDDSVDFWLPIRITGDERNHREWRGFYRAAARLRPGCSVAEARTELQGISATLAHEFPDTNRGWSVQLVPIADRVLGDVRLILWMLMAASGTLLLLALVNVAGLLLVRGVSRQQELAVRQALGADRRRLVRQLLTESLLLGVSGGGLGVLLAIGGAALIRRLAPAELPLAEEIAVDGRVLLFVLVISVLTGLLIGIVPALFATASDPGSVLKSASRTTTRGRSSRWAINTLAAGAVAVSIVLLIAAALLQQSLLRVLSTPGGFDHRNLLTMAISLPEASYTWRRNTEFCHEVIEAVQVAPGIVNAAAIRGVPTQETRFEARVIVEHAPELPIDEQPLVKIRVVSPEYFETMSIPLLAGRAFEPGDEEGQIGYAHAIVINQAMAKQFWPQEDAVGKRVRINTLVEWSEIVGVVLDVRYEGLDRPPVPEMYYPDALFPQTNINLVVRTATAPEYQINTVRAAVLKVDPAALISDVQTMEQVIETSVADRRFAAMIVSWFSVVGFVLAVVGVYGVVACSVADRTQELAIRFALGARPRQIIGRVLRHSLLTSGSGVIVGLLLSFAGVRTLSALLYGIQPTDPATYVTVSALLLLVATAATLVPAWRATRVDPASTLRHQ